MKDTPRNIHTKLDSYLSSSVRGDFFKKEITFEKAKKRQNGGITPTWLNKFTQKFDLR